MLNRLALILFVPIALLLGAQAAWADNSQNGADMVIINPGGGQALDGSDGLLSVFNGEEDSNPNFFSANFEFAPEDGSDQQFFANTDQWCCAGVGPILYAGTPTPLINPFPSPSSTFIGEAGGAASNDADSWGATGTAPNVGGVEIVSISGAVVRVPAGDAANPANFPSPAPTGSGSAVIRYTGIVGGLAYVIDRAISYTYPNNFYTETYTFTVPSGNTDPVQFYLGGDAAPGSNDNGRGALTISPNRVLYEINENSEIFVAYGEVGSPATSPFTSGWVADYSDPYDSIERGYSLVTECPAPDIVDTDFCIDTTSHDAGMDIQWTIPANPGTYTRQMRTIVGFQGQSISARFTPSSVQSGQSSDLEIELVNTGFSAVSGVDFSLPLPTGLSISGSATNSCNGTLTAASGGTSVALSGGDLPGGGNCLVTVPVKGEPGSYTVNDQDFQALAPVTLTKGFGNSTLEVTGDPTPPTPPGKPNLKVSFTTPKKVTGGKSFGVKLKVTNRAGEIAASRAGSPRAGVEARSVKTCLTIPSPLITVKAKGSKINGRTACWTRSTLGTGKSVTYSATIKAPLSSSGSKSLRATVTASDSDGGSVKTSGRAKVTVKKAKPPRPKPPTG